LKQSRLCGLALPWSAAASTAQVASSLVDLSLDRALAARARRGTLIHLQAYYVQTTRTQQVLDTWDIEGTYAHRPGRHHVVLGGSHRYQHDRIETQPNLAVIPSDKKLHTAMRRGTLSCSWWRNTAIQT